MSITSRIIQELVDKSNKIDSSSFSQTIDLLISELEKLPEIKKVNPRFKNFPDIHWIVFQIELNPYITTSVDIWDHFQSVVLDYEWKLRDKTNEEWYFSIEEAWRL